MTKMFARVVSFFLICISAVSAFKNMGKIIRNINITESKKNILMLFFCFY